MILYDRKASVIIENLQFSLDDFDIEFEVNFTSDIAKNTCEATIYNLTKDTMNKFQLGDRFRVSAGYGHEVNIFQGIISDLEIEYTDVDSALKIGTMDDLQMFDNYVPNRQYVRPFRKGITALEVINKLSSEFGLALGQIHLRKNKVFKRGITLAGDLKDFLNHIAQACESELNIHNGVIDIIPLRYTDETHQDEFGTSKLYYINTDSGLLSSPTLEQEEFAGDINQEDLEGEGIRDILRRNKYNVECLLNPNLKPNERVQIRSNTANGIFVISEGKHICNESDFKTELKIEPYEPTDINIPSIVSPRARYMN